MSRRPIVFLFAATMAAAGCETARAQDSINLPEPEDRIALARTNREGSIRAHCAAAGLSYPPRELFLRAFKHERIVEAWGREDDRSMRLIATYPLTASSGGPGPKRREGDLQVPEGCYSIAVFNPQSAFHLSLGLNYPNAADRVLADPEQPGTDIYLHGGAVSSGCLPLGDPAIEELFLLAFDGRNRAPTSIPVHIFPARMQGAFWSDLKVRYPQHAAFWSELQPIYEAFEKTHFVPETEVTADGRYVVGRSQ
jgi:murein L,D-transpeptidase YafK